MSVRTLVKSIQDIMRKDVGVDGDAQRISQMAWMFFLKIIDDQDQELEMMNREYRSPTPKASPATNSSISSITSSSPDSRSSRFPDRIPASRSFAAFSRTHTTT